MGRACSTKGRTGILVGKPEEKRQLGRPTHACNDNIKIDLRETDRMGWY
jgi:hypothetical protein